MPSLFSAEGNLPQDIGGGATETVEQGLVEAIEHGVTKSALISAKKWGALQDRTDFRFIIGG